MTIHSFSKDDVDLLNEVVLSFYSPDNPLFGKCIFKDKHVAIYERSTIKKPKSLPYTYDFNGEGIVYISYQARGDFLLPLVICNHRFELESRDRENIYLGTILDILMDMVDYIDTETSYYLLEKLERYWYDYPAKKSDIDSWYPIIRKLICKVAYSNNNIREKFIKNYPNLVVCEKPNNISMRNLKKQALTWKRLCLPDARLVQDNFSILGYKTIVTLCRDAGGFNILRRPDDKEKQLIKILENAAKEIFSGFFIDCPDYYIIENDSSAYDGTADLFKNSKNVYNKYGFLFRYKVINVSIKKSSLTKDNFAKAFSTYCHELSHCFGGDSSCVFSRALTDVIEIILKNNERLLYYNQLWNEQFENYYTSTLDIGFEVHSPKAEYLFVDAATDAFSYILQ